MKITKTKPIYLILLLLIVIGTIFFIYTQKETDDLTVPPTPTTFTSSSTLPKTELDAPGSYLKLNGVLSESFYTYNSLVNTLSDIDTFETIEDITDFELVWKEAIIKLDEIVETLSCYTPDKEYEKTWSSIYEDFLTLRELCLPFTDLDLNADGKYTSKEINEIYNTGIPKLKDVVTSIVEIHRAFNEIEPEFSIVDLIGSGYVWISDGRGIQNPYDRFVFDFENMKFIWDFKSPQASFHEEYEIRLVDEHTIEVSGVRDEKVPAQIFVINANKLKVVFLEDIMFNGKVLDMSDSYLLRTNESADSYIYADKDEESSSFNYEYSCVECGKNAPRSYTNPFSGKCEHYCESHYQEIIDVMGVMEQDVGSSTQSKHTCEECSREGTHRYKSFTGQTEYYCTRHYEELQEMLDSFGLE